MKLKIHILAILILYTIGLFSQDETVKIEKADPFIPEAAAVYDHNIELEDCQLTALPVKMKYGKMPILFNLFEYEENLEGSCSFDSGIYTSDSMELVIQRFKKVLQSFVDNPKEKVKHLKTTLDIEQPSLIEFDLNF